MSKSTFWGLALATVVVSGAVAASTIAPALTREDGEENEVAYLLDPEDGAIVNDLQTITISFEDKKVLVNEKMEGTTIVLTNTDTQEEYYCDAPVRNDRAAEGVAYQLNFLSPVETEEGTEEQLLPITTPGNYTLSIMGNTFISADEVEDENGTVNYENVVPVQAIEATYTVVEAAPQVAYTLDPENEAIVNNLQTITVSFENKNVVPNDKMEPSAIVLTNIESGEEYYCDGPLRLDREAEGIAYQLNFMTLVENEDGIENVFEPITTPGAYTLTIMGNTFLCVNEENTVPVQAINATYTVVEAAPQVAYTLDPENEAIVNDLQTITISFDSKKVMPNEKMEASAIVLTNTETGEEYYCDAPVRLDRAAEGVAYQLNFLTQVESEEGVEGVLEPITTPGIYSLSILGNTFISADEVEDEDGNVTYENVVPVEAINATYTVVEAAPQVAYTLDPENEAIVNDLQTVTISFDSKKVLPNEKMEASAIVLTNIETGEEYYCDAPVRLDRAAEGVAYQLNFLTLEENEEGIESVLEPITTPGNYTLSIMVGTFICGDEVEDEEGNVTLENIVPVQAINATYTVVEAAPKSAYTLDPENGAIVPDLQTITVSFEDKNIQPNQMMEFNAIVLTNIETGEEYYCDAPVRLDRVAEGVAYQLNFMTLEENEYGIEEQLLPITTPGTYTLSILANTFISVEEVEDEEGNIVPGNIVPVEAINATYTVDPTSGVNSVLDTEATEFNVYTINGVQVLKAADSNAVNALPNGLYIINGKKVLKK